jgi:RHS repeat-associated protein
MMKPAACATNVSFTQYRYTGKERDAESGLDDFGARYFASTMGRFSSPDPSGLFYADPSNPQSFNLYAYVQNNPLVNFDPDGLDCFTTSNLTSSSVTVTTYVGATSCDGIKGGTYVNGTINTSSYMAQVGSDGDVHVGFGYASNDASTSSNTLSVNVGSTDIGPAVQGDGHAIPDKTAV